MKPWRRSNVVMTQSIAGAIISWVAFVFLIIVGFESSRRFSEKMKTIEDVSFFERFFFRRFLYPVSPGFWFLFAMLVLFSKPFSTEWMAVVALSYVAILHILFRKITTARAK
jgi:hypothetical protein